MNYKNFARLIRAALAVVVLAGSLGLVQLTQTALAASGTKLTVANIGSNDICHLWVKESSQSDDHWKDTLNPGYGIAQKILPGARRTVTVRGHVYYDIVAMGCDNREFGRTMNFFFSSGKAYAWDVNSGTGTNGGTNHRITLSITDLTCANGEEDAWWTSSGSDEVYILYSLCRHSDGQCSRAGWGVFDIQSGESYSSARYEHFPRKDVLDVPRDDGYDVYIGLLESDGGRSQYIVNIWNDPYSDTAVAHWSVDGDDQLGLVDFPVYSHAQKGRFARSEHASGSNNGDRYDYWLSFTIDTR